MKKYTKTEGLKKEIMKAIEDGKKIRRVDVKKVNKSNLQDGYNLSTDKQRQELNLALLDIYGRMEEGDINNLFDSILYVTFGANDDKEKELATSMGLLEEAEAKLEELLAKKSDTKKSDVAKAIEEEREKEKDRINKSHKSTDEKKKKIAEIEAKYDRFLEDNSAYVKKLKDKLRNLKQKQKKTEGFDKRLNSQINELTAKVEKLSSYIANDGLDIKIKEQRAVVARRQKEVENKANMEESAFEKKTSKENRIKAHEDGLTFKRTFTSKNGEEFDVVEHFDYWMRSSSQSRKGTEQYFRTSKIVTNKTTGEIVEKIDNSKLFEEHKEWLNLGMEEKEQGAVELGAYNSLVSSKLETIVQIDAKKHILIIPDVEKNITERGYLNSYDEVNKCIKTELKDDLIFTNSLFDGQSIGSKEFFEQNLKDRSGSSQLFRQRFTKFNCVNVDFQEDWKMQFEEDKKNGKYPKDMKYEDLMIRNIDGRMVKACEVKVITTPSAIKLNKMTMKDSNGKRMSTIEKLSKWYDLVSEDDNCFGIVKEEHSAKVEDLLSEESAIKTTTNEIQNSSYQHISSLQYEDGLGDKLFSEKDRAIIEELQNNPSFFADYLERNLSDMNDYEHHLNLMRANADYCNTKEYHEYVNNVVKQYAKKCRKGGVKVDGSYHTILMNPELMVDFAYDPDKFRKQCKEDEDGLTTYTLKDEVVSDEYGEYQISVKDENGEVVRDESGKIIKEDIDGVKFFSKGMAYNEECALLRNPHATASNIGHGVNCCNPQAKNRLARLFKNISANVIVIDGTRYAIQDTLQGSDQDSDTVLVTSQEDMVKNGKNRKKLGYYTVKTDSSLNKETNAGKENAEEHMALANDKLKASGRNIGEVANTSQLVMAQLYEIVYQLNREDLDKALKNLSEDKDYLELRELIKKINGLEEEYNLREAKIKAKQEQQKKELEQTEKGKKKELREKFKAEIKAEQEELKEELAKNKPEIDKIKAEIIAKTDIVASKHESLNKWIVQQDTKNVKEQMLELKKELNIQLAKLSSLEGMAIDGAKRLFKVSIQAELKKVMSVLMKDIDGNSYAPLYFKNCGIKVNLPRFKMHSVMDDIVTLDMGVKLNKEASKRLEDMFNFDFLEEDKFKKHIDKKMYDYAFEKFMEANKEIKALRLTLSETKDMDDRKSIEVTISEIKERVFIELHDFVMVDKKGDIIKTNTGRTKKHNINKPTRYRILKDAICPNSDVENKQDKKECMKLIIEVFGEEMLGAFEKGVSVTPFSKQQRRAEQIEKEVFAIAMNQADLYGKEVKELAKETIKKLRELDLSNLDSETLEEILSTHEGQLTEIRNKVNIDEIITHSYDKTLYNFSQNIGIAVNFNKINPKVVKAILTEPFHNKTFNERLDNSVKRYEQEFRAILLNMQLTGISIEQAVNMFNERTDHNCKGVEMIIRTQSNYYSNRANAEAMKEIGFEKYIYVATLDSRTSTICQELDGQIFSVDDKENLPPQHPNCRSTIVSSFNDEIIDKNRTRLAKDKNGNWVRVKGITYNEYREKYLK